MSRVDASLPSLLHHENYYFEFMVRDNYLLCDHDIKLDYTANKKNIVLLVYGMTLNKSNEDL